LDSASTYALVGQQVKEGESLLLKVNAQDFKR
jgi:hypothetical protein